MPRFRPQRQFGQWLLRALGAIDHITGRTITNLEWESTILPTVEVGAGQGLPGQVSVPKREVYGFGISIAAVIAEHARIVVYSEANTFSTRDPRTASGCFVLGWRVSHASGVLANPPQVAMGVPTASLASPGPNVPGALGTVWGVETAQVAVTADLVNNRSPRVQCIGGAVPVGAAGTIPYAALTHNDRGTLYTGPPLYVPPGQAFQLHASTADTNIAMVMTAIYVEAEEGPVEVPLQ